MRPEAILLAVTSYKINFKKSQISNMQFHRVNIAIPKERSRIAGSIRWK